MPTKLHKKSVDPVVKVHLGFKENELDDEIHRWWKKASTKFCKPCWELKYCPYGVIVEDFPLLPPTKESAIAHNEYLKDCLQTGILGDGQPIDDDRRTWFQQEIESFDPKTTQMKFPNI